MAMLLFVVPFEIVALPKIVYLVLSEKKAEIRGVVAALAYSVELEQLAHQGFSVFNAVYE